VRRAPDCTAQVQLQAYAQPAAARASKPGGEITPERLFEDGPANTLYLVADREYQTMLAPLIVTLLSSLLHHTAQLDNTGGELRVPALFALDEAANIAPLEKLPQIRSTSLPSARFLTIWHSVVQLRKAYGEAAAAEILALSQAKIFLGSITDTFTTRELSGLIGQRASQRGQNPELLIGQALQRTEAGEGLMIHTSYAPVFFDQRYYYKDRGFADLQQAAETAKAAGVKPKRPRCD
jgi:type IV secretory pathway TraG/TraD family ATPase VirD4